MVKPGQDDAVMKLGEEIIKINTYAQRLTIAGDGDLDRATNDLLLISGLKKSMEEKRKEYTGPLRKHLEEVGDAFKLLAAPLLEADRLVQEKIRAYQRVQEERLAEQQRINDLRIEAAHAEQRLNGELSQPVDLVEETRVPTRIQTDVGTVGTVKNKKYEIVDFAALPDEYKMPDAAKIGKVVRAGIPSIPGVRIYEEASLRTTLRK